MASRKVTSGESDGASAIAHEFDTGASLSTTGAKLFSLKNAGVEVFSIDKDGLTPGSFVTIVKPSEGEAGIQAALTAINAAGGGIVQLLAGTYTLNTGLSLIAANNVELRGVGDATVLDMTAVITAIGWSGTVTYSAGNVPLNNITAQDTTITTTTAGDAAAATLGSYLRIFGIDSISGDSVVEFHKVAVAGDGGTGDIVLERPISRTLTSAVIGSGQADNENMAVRNLKIINTSAGAALPININRGYKCTIENVTVDGAEDSLNAFQMSFNGESIVKNCHVENVQQSGVLLRHQSGLLVSGNTFLNNATIVGGGRPHILVGRKSTDVIIENNILDTGLDTGIETDSASGGEGPNGENYGWKIRGNILNNFNETGIEIFGKEIEVSNNMLTSCALTTLSSGQAVIRMQGDRFLVKGNNINIGRAGIRLFGGSDMTASNNIINNPREYGIQFASVNNGVCSNNRVINNTAGSYCILLSLSTKISVVGNVLTNAPRGVLFSDSDNCVYAHNVSENMSLAGIELDSNSNDNLIIGNLTNGDGITQGAGSNTFVSNID